MSTPIDRIGSRCVASFWNSSTGWRWAEFADLLPSKILILIAAIGINEGNDSICWNGSHDGNYSVRSGYELLQ